MKKPTLICCVVLAILSSVVGCQNEQAELQALNEAKLNSVRQMQMPASMEELERIHYPHVPSNDNVALLYLQAFDALADVEPTAPGYLSQNQKALSLLHKTAQSNRSYCRYPVDLSLGQGTLLPHLPAIKKSAQLLALEARNHSLRQRRQASVDSLLVAWKMTVALEAEPILISALVRQQCEKVILDALQDILGQHELSSDEILTLLNGLGPNKDGQDMSLALISERCFGLSIMYADAAVQAEFLGPQDSSRWDLANYGKSLSFQKDLGLFLDSFEKLILASDLGYPDCWSAFSDPIEEIRMSTDLGYLWTPQFLGMIVGKNQASVMDRFGEAEAKRRVARTALGIELYRDANLALPESLEVLSDNHPVPPPRDPFNGELLRYRKIPPRGYLVYSLGTNRKDDGGDSTPMNKRPLDIVFGE